jgi:MoxR-like ATPase
MEQKIGVIRLNVNIPSQKILAAAMLLAEEYKPLVAEALEEAKREFMTDGVYKESVKDAIKSRLKEQMQKALTETAAYAADRAIQNMDMYSLAKSLLKDKL